jgi:hypothetical protein
MSVEQNLKNLAERWASVPAGERSNYQMYITELAEALDVPRPQPKYVAVALGAITSEIPQGQLIGRPRQRLAPAPPCLAFFHDRADSGRSGRAGVVAGDVGRRLAPVRGSAPRARRSSPRDAGATWRGCRERWGLQFAVTRGEGDVSSRSMRASLHHSRSQPAAVAPRNSQFCGRTNANRDAGA